MPIVINFRQIEVFHAVMIAKTVSGAARLLNVSQPGLSRTLKYTEDRLGFSLFDRIKGRLVPTKEAIALFTEIEAIYHKIDGLEDHIKRLRRGEGAIFRIGAQPSVGHTIVPRALGEMKRKFDDLIIQFDILSRQQVAPYLLQEEGEYVVGVFSVSHPNIISEEICTTPLVCVLKPGHPLCARESVDVSDLADEPLVSFRVNTPHGMQISAAFQEAKVERNVSTYVRFAETACNFVRNGLGVAIVDAFTVLENAGVGVEVRPLTPSRRMSLYVHRNKLASRSLFADIFEAELKVALSSFGHSPLNAGSHNDRR